MSMQRWGMAFWYGGLLIAGYLLVMVAISGELAGLISVAFFIGLAILGHLLRHRGPVLASAGRFDAAATGVPEPGVMVGRARGLEMPIVYDDQEVRSESRPDGALGPALRRAGAARIAEHIGDDLDWLPRQKIRGVTEHRAHIVIGAKLSTLKTSYLAIPKDGVVYWQRLLGRDLPRAAPDSKALTVFGGLLGSLVGGIIAMVRFKKEQGMPVIDLVYQAGDEEHSIFLEFSNRRQHQALERLLEAALPNRRRGSAS